MTLSRKQRRAFRYGRRIQRPAENHWRDPSQCKHPASRVIADYFQCCEIRRIDEQLYSYAV